MNAKAVLQLRIRFADGGPEYLTEMTLDRDAVEACVLAAAERPNVAWRAVANHTHTWLTAALRNWAERAMPARVQKAREPEMLATMLMSNLRRAEEVLK